LLENGEIKIYIDSVFNLEDVVKAHQRLEEGKHIGKIVLNFKD
jgi:NADPH:quinone reductase-like Zn-dependent oxidoreductase